MNQLHKSLIRISNALRCASIISSSLTFKAVESPFIGHRHLCTLPKNKSVLAGVCVTNATTQRNYAKGKDRKKEKGKAKVQVDENQLAEVMDVDVLKSQMEKCLNQLKDDFIKNLSLRSTTGSIEMLKIEIDGKEHTLQEVAQVVRKNPKLLVINMAVFPQAIPAVVKAIQKSGMNLNPQQEGTTLYVPVPKVTKEHRENLAKNAKQLFVKCKTSLKDLQTKQIKSLKRKEKLSEDVARGAEQQIVAIVDSYVTEGERILEAKQKELVGGD